MNAEFIEALNALEKERGIKKAVLLNAFEFALVNAYKRNYDKSANVRAEVNGDTGEYHMYASKTVVETVENPALEISLERASIRSMSSATCSRRKCSRRTFPALRRRPRSRS